MKILFLGYPECRVLTFLRENHDVFQTQKRMKNKRFSMYDLVISFGYRYLLSKEALSYCYRIPINLHISYLPWNRGADPNYWSFVDDTPKGVSIHLIDEGLDTGDLLFRKKVRFFSYEDTLALTYQRLFDEIQDLFIRKWGILHYGTLCYLRKMPQGEGGSCHSVGDMPELPDAWNTKVQDLMN